MAESEWRRGVGGKGVGTSVADEPKEGGGDVVVEPVPGVVVGVLEHLEQDPVRVNREVRAWALVVSPE